MGKHSKGEKSILDYPIRAIDTGWVLKSGELHLGVVVSETDNVKDIKFITIPRRKA